MSVSTVTPTPTMGSWPVVGAGAVAEPPAPVSPELLARAGSPDYRAWLSHVLPAAACSHPIRLGVETEWSDGHGNPEPRERVSDDMPDGSLYVACKNRRRSMCPGCAETYRADTYQLIKAGLVGGKGIPDAVAAHPCVFATFSAPSFGPVHTAGKAAKPRPCQPRRNPETCPHGIELACWERHSAENPVTGTPLCPQCYDYQHQAVWNLHTGELWHRTTIALTRALAPLARSLGTKVRVSYAKVAELQARGAVHFHAMIRLDGYNPDNPAAILAPHPGITTDHLASAVQDAARGTLFDTEPHPRARDGWPITWGEQLDTRPVRLSPDDMDEHGALSSNAVAGYLAKYSTKATEDTGLPTTRKLTAESLTLLEDLHGVTHQTRQLRACWELGTRPLSATTDAERAHWHTGWGRLQKWAHMLGYAGHFSTKSRRYSVTLTALRNVRKAFQRGQQPTPAELATTTAGSTAQADSAAAEVIVNYTFLAVGWLTTADAQLANTAAAKAREHRQAAKYEIEAEL